MSMMFLLALLALPVLVALATLVLGKGKITLKEFAVHQAAQIAIIAGFYGAALGITRCSATYDTELWNGVVEKKKGTRKAGREYFHACIIEPNGCPPVTAAAAQGERPTGGETSESTAK